MGSLSNDMELKVLDHLLGNTAFGAAADLYLALGTGTSTETGLQTEVSGTNYARVLMNGTWNTVSRTTTYNTATTFATAGAGGWGTVSEWAVYDAITAGNPVAYGQIVTPRLVNENDIPSIASAEVFISWNASTGNSGFTTSIAAEMLEHIVGNATSTQPAAVYVGFGTVALTDGAAITGEASAGNYARVDAKTSFGAAAAGACSNDTAITFDASVTDWTASLGTIFISSSLTSLLEADLLFFGTVTPFSALGDDTVEISIGGLTITLD